MVSDGRVEVFGRYLVYEALGVGGMARVDRAELVGIEGFRRPVALKRMLPHVAASDDMVRAFVREARLLGYLRHANLAQTYELGKVDGVYFIAMELVTGPTLREVLQRCAQTTGPMPIRLALNILGQVCDALEHAHNRCDEAGQPLGIIHRDVSPSNVIVDEAGVVKLIDFGVAKASAAGMQTMSGMIKGKFGYMAPEYLAGEIDARADLFAVGVIAHELLTSRPLFTTADDLETMQRLRRLTIPPPSEVNPEVPPEIDAIVLKALARDPDQRWQAAAALRAALTRAAERLGLPCTNREVIEWIGRAAEEPITAPRPRSLAPPRARSVRPADALCSLIEEHAETTLDDGTAPFHRIATAPLTPLVEISPPRPPPRPPGLALAPKRPPMLLPMPAPPQPLPYHPRRGTTAAGARLVGAAPARRAVLVALLVLLAAGLAAAGAYLVLARLA